MEIQKATKRKLIGFPFVFLFFFFIFVNVVSATAQWNAIPEKDLTYFQSGTPINLNNYCSSSNGGSCAVSSFSIVYNDPDTGSQVTLNSFTTSSSNSYFSISLTNGNVYINSNGKPLTIYFNAYASDIAFQSGNIATTFKLVISQVSAPLQIASFAPANIYGNATITYDMNFFWQNYNSISVVYSELNGSINLVASKGGAMKCNSGLLSVCLIPQGTSDIILSIFGNNTYYNSSSTLGGNVFNVIATNNAGSTGGNGFAVTSYPTSASNPVYSSLPFRKPISINSIQMVPNQSLVFDPSYIYGNYTYINITFNGLSQPIKQNISCVPYGGVGTGCYFNGYNAINVNGSARILENLYAPNGSIIFTSFPEYREYHPENPPPFWWVVTAPTMDLISIYVDNAFPQFSSNIVSYLLSSHTANESAIYNISACNNIGCINTDAFGNKDLLYVNVITNPPFALPFTPAPLIIPFTSIKSFDTNKLFVNYTRMEVIWNESNVIYNLTTGISQSTSNSTTITDGSGNPIYKVELTQSGNVFITSATTERNFTMTFLACNQYGCINGGLVPASLDVVITSANNKVEGVTNSWFNAVYNTILGLFPDASTLTDTQKTNIIIITMLLLDGVILFFGFRADEVSGVIKMAGILDLILFIFFLFIGYAPSSVLLVLGIIAGAIIFLFIMGKIFGGGGS